MTIEQGATRRRVGRPAQITREQVVAAAVSVGIDQLSMVSVAESLGVKHSSLYNHVAGRDEMLALAVDRIFADAPWPEPTDSWRDDATALAVEVWRLMRAHPGLAGELARRYTTPVALDGLRPHYWAFIGELRATVSRSGLDPVDVIALADIILEVSYAHGTAGWRSDDHDPAALRGADGALRDALAATLSLPPEEMLRRKLALILRGATPSSTP
ncbi:TetR/AcrR family transcriptional regulator [Microbacterium sp. NPDC055683]